MRSVLISSVVRESRSRTLFLRIFTWRRSEWWWPNSACLLTHTRLQPDDDDDGNDWSVRALLSRDWWDWWWWCDVRNEWSLRSNAFPPLSPTRPRRGQLIVTVTPVDAGWIDSTSVNIGFKFSPLPRLLEKIEIAVNLRISVFLACSVWFRWFLFSQPEMMMLMDERGIL